MGAVRGGVDSFCHQPRWHERATLPLSTLYISLLVLGFMVTVLQCSDGECTPDAVPVAVHAAVSQHLPQLHHLASAMPFVVLAHALLAAGFTSAVLIHHQPNTLAHHLNVFVQLNVLYGVFFLALDELSVPMPTTAVLALGVAAAELYYILHVSFIQASLRALWRQPRTLLRAL